MLAGYSSVYSAGWGIVSQQSRERTLLPINDLMYQMFIGVLPLGLLGLFFICLFAYTISSPLRLLASATEKNDIAAAERDISQVRTWYTEATYIREALLKGIALIHEKMEWLNNQANLDPLTGLLNRRATENELMRFEHTQTAFALIYMDIDHFKWINDALGHDAGDAVLKILASVLKENCRNEDRACRMGGEEFLLLLPELSVQAAVEIAERLRKKVAQTKIEGAHYVTISLGITSWTGNDHSIHDVLKKADELMYRAKNGGRNRSEWS